MTYLLPINTSTVLLLNVLHKKVILAICLKSQSNSCYQHTNMECSECASMIKNLMYKYHNFHLLYPSIALNSSVKRFCLLTGGIRFNLDSSTTFSSLLGFSGTGAFPQFTRHMSRPINLLPPVILSLLFCDLQVIGTSSTSKISFPSNSLPASCGKGCKFSLTSLHIVSVDSVLYNKKSI